MLKVTWEVKSKAFKTVSVDSAVYADNLVERPTYTQAFQELTLINSKSKSISQFMCFQELTEV